MLDGTHSVVVWLPSRRSRTVLSDACAPSSGSAMRAFGSLPVDVEDLELHVVDVEVVGEHIRGPAGGAVRMIGVSDRCRLYIVLFL